MSGSYTQRWMKPAQIFAQFSMSTQDKAATKISAQDEQTPPPLERTLSLGSTNSPEIQVSESAEISLPPDRAKVVISCTNIKDSVEDVKNSVNRRVDYIVQTLKAHHVKDNHYTMHRNLQRIEKGYQLYVELIVFFHDFILCEQVCNLLTEKLDNSVSMTSPVFHHSSGKVEALRRQACIHAVRNAKIKAIEIARCLNQVIGQATVIREEKCDEFTGPSMDTSGGHLDQPMTLEQKISNATVTVCVKVFVAFELKKKSKNGKKK